MLTLPGHAQTRQNGTPRLVKERMLRVEAAGVDRAPYIYIYIYIPERECNGSWVKMCLRHKYAGQDAHMFPARAVKQGNGLTP